MTEPLLRVKNLVKHFLVKRRHLLRRGRAGPCGQRCELRNRCGGDPGFSGRIRLRQVHYRALYPASDRANLGRGVV
jgi:hypothetical protein